MKNTIARTVGGLINQTNNAITGLQTYAATLNLNAVTPAAFTAALGGLTTSQNTVNAERSELGEERQTLRTLINDARTYVGLGRDILKPHLGKEHNVAWIEAGFLNSLRVPTNPDKLLPLLSAMAAHFVAHPEQQNETLNVLGARATTFFNDITTARQDVTSQKATVAAAITDRDAKMKALVMLLRVLTKELGLKLDPMDDRYLAFGFNRPGQLATPDMPEGVVAVVIGPGAVAVKWNKAARAAHYRVWKRVVGVDEALVALGSTGDLDFMIEGLPANANIEIAVSAVNNGGESAETEVVIVHTA